MPTNPIATHRTFMHSLPGFGRATLGTALRIALRRILVATIAWLAATTAWAVPVTVVEFYNASLDHYFISSLAADIDALDSGRIPGWMRTGYTFVASDTPGPGLNAVCRYLIPPQHGDSHFFSASPDECAAVAQKVATDPNYSGYILETSAAFYIALPDIVSGTCPAGTVAVFRLWNRRVDSNHRYTADANVRARMLAAGYLPEGYGPQGVAMCAVSAGRGESQVRVSAASPFPAGCDGVIPQGTRYIDAEVEPFVAVDPSDPEHFIGVWQQDRWSTGGAAALRTGTSFDAGLTWTLTNARFTRCSDGTAANGANYARASDPWVTIAPDGTAYQIAIAFNGQTFAAGSTSAVLVSRSTDRGATWSDAVTLIQDGSSSFNDKESITADPTDARFAYAVWDRLNAIGSGPTYFSRTPDHGQSWELPRPIYDPGNRAQTLNNQIVVLPDGTLIAFFNEIATSNRMAVMRSSDKGATWSAPIYIATQMSVGARDPDTGIEIRDAADLGAIAAGRNGKLAVVWQDARFPNPNCAVPGTPACIVDAIAYSQSTDGGVTWSTPVRVNSVAGAQAFIPSVAIRDDGVVAVSYYDMRNNTSDIDTLPVDAWLSTSGDGVVWAERHLSGPFDFTFAPIVQDGSASGYFIGDYQGLAAAGNAWVPFFAQTNASTVNRTDIFASFVPLIAPQASAKALVAIRRAESLPTAEPSSVLQDLVRSTTAKVLARRLNRSVPSQP